MPRSATIRDVAERAGCGVATVSRVLNDTGPASADVRQRVLAAADALGFEFSDVARSLQSQRSRTIGCLVPSLVNPVFSDAVQAVQARVLREGYHLLLMCSDYDPALEDEAIRTLAAKKVEGLILTVSDAATSPGLALLRARHLPFCLMFNAPAGADAAMYVDNRAAAAMVAERFAAFGHRHTGFVALAFKGSDRSRQRFEGFRAACCRFDLAPPILIEIDEMPSRLAEVLHGLLEANANLTAIFASNDCLALAVMRAARTLGRRVPEDLSVVGFDGIAVGEWVEPTLATIATDPRRMGAHAADALFATITADMPVPAPALALPFSFRPGASLGPPPPTGKAAQE